MRNFKKDILDALIDKYERSRTFSGDNQVNQKFQADPEQLFSGYADEMQYDLFMAVNEAAKELTTEGLVTLKSKRNGVISRIILDMDHLGQAYAALHREPRKQMHTRLETMLRRYLGYHEILDAFCKDQLMRIQNNRKVSYYDDDESFEHILMALSRIMSVSEEMYVRDFSMQVFGDSKVFEGIRAKITGILYEYGDFPEKETILEELNIVRNPGHVHFKGDAALRIAGNDLELGSLNGDIALSTKVLKQIERIQVYAGCVMTIENLTTFNMFSVPGVFAVYLGGYHNRDRREFIQLVYEQNPDKKYLHFGDIDAGGFNILQHLRMRTGIDFMPFRMDIETLEHYRDYWKPLTENDRKRLKSLLETEFSDTVRFMLANNCKLEQEAMD